MRALLVGQAPALSDPRPWRSDAGRRLARYAGTTHEELLRVFEPRNLVPRHHGRAGKYDVLDPRLAREGAERLRARVIPRRRVALVCGVATARHLGLPPLGATRVGACDVYTVPHPAGTSMWWNDPENALAGRLVAREAWLHARSLTEGEG